MTGNKKMSLLQQLKAQYVKQRMLDDVEAGVTAYYLGLLYESGFGGPVDYMEAVTWYTNSADEGFDVAMYKLADLYAHGYGVDKDIRKQKGWYERAYDAGGVIAGLAAYQLGMMERDYHFADMPNEPLRAFRKECSWFWESVQEGYDPAWEYVGYFAFQRLFALLDPRREKMDLQTALKNFGVY